MSVASQNALLRGRNLASVASTPVELPGIGVFGTGPTVRCLIPILKHHGFRVEALWGRTKELAENCAKELNINFQTDKVDDVLLHKDVELVFVQCPPHLQSPIAAKALGIGKHVVCGTPAGPSQVDALKMVHAAEYYPKLMSVMCNGLRFLHCFQKMKQLIGEGYVGEVTVIEARVHCGSVLKDHYDWMCDELMGGGVLNSYGSLMVDLIMFLTNQKVTHVHGMLQTFTKHTDKIKGIRQITSDDFCSFQMVLDKGTCATVTINSHVPGKYTQEVLVCGTKSRLIAQGMELRGVRNDCSSKEERLVTELPDIVDEDYKRCISDTAKQNIPAPQLKGIMELVSSVKKSFMAIPDDKHAWSDVPLTQASNFADGQYIQTVIDMIRKSHKTKEWVRVKLLTEEPDPIPYLSDAMRKSTFSLH